MININTDQTFFELYSSLLGIPSLPNDIEDLQKYLNQKQYEEAFWIIAKYLNYDAKVLISYINSLYNQDPSKSLLNLEILLNRTVPDSLKFLINNNNSTSEEICLAIPVIKNVPSVPALAKTIKNNPTKVIDTVGQLSGYSQNKIDLLKNTFTNNSSKSFLNLVIQENNLDKNLEQYIFNSISESLFDRQENTTHKAAPLVDVLEIGKTLRDGVIVRTGTISSNIPTGYISLTQDNTIVKQVCDDTLPGVFFAENILAGEYTLNVYVQGYKTKSFKVNKKNNELLFTNETGLLEEGLTLFFEDKEN
jgi:hypothetical protein